MTTQIQFLDRDAVVAAAKAAKQLAQDAEDLSGIERLRQQILVAQQQLTEMEKALTETQAGSR